MNKNIKNIGLVVVMIMVVAMLVGCGKTKPVSATSSTPVETVTSELEKIETEITLTPTATPTAEPTVSIPTATPTTSVVISSTEFIFDGNFDFPEEDEKALKELEESHIIPFLDGYYIAEKHIERTGSRVYGIEEYLMTYVCEKGGRRLTLEFRSRRATYITDKVKDEIVYDFITEEYLVNNEWIIIGEYRDVRGIAEHMN
ncbi:MAG: hypothetical protein K6G36_03525 [Candidatus Saccharibacteria bacterium]|nr:hypothetical protein [Candidatus Saccharibacteria bacterium]